MIVPQVMYIITKQVNITLMLISSIFKQCQLWIKSDIMDKWTVINIHKQTIWGSCYGCDDVMSVLCTHSSNKV